MILNNSNHFQVMVIGSGPAGGRAAHLLAKSNIKTAILEKSSLPRIKTCAGGITWRGLTFLPKGLNSVIEQECKTVDLFIHDIPRSFSSRSQNTLIAMVQRSQFDYALTSKATEEGAYLFDQTCVQRLTTYPKGVEVITDRGKFSADFVILADGAHSPIAKSINWPDHRNLVPAIEADLELEEKYNVPRFDFGFCKSGYGWVFPKKERLSVGMLSKNGKTLRADFMGYLNHLGLKLSTGSLKGHPIPMSPRKGPFVKDRILLVGDSAGFVDPITGEGISYALKSGIIAGQCILEGCMDPHLITEKYRKRIKNEILRDLQIGSFLANFLYGPSWIRAAAFKIYGPAMCRAMCTIIEGKKSYFELAINFKNYLHLFSRSSIKPDDSIQLIY